MTCNVASNRPVLLLTGPPGVGKTTAAGLLATRSDRAVHLEADRFFNFIRSGYVEPWKPESREQNTTVMRIVAHVAAGYAAAGYFTIVDGIIMPRWFLEPLGDSLRAEGHRVAFAVLRAPLDVCASRASIRESEPPADPDVGENLWRDFSDLGVLESHAIEIGTKTPEEVAELLADRLGAGSLAL